MNSGRREFSVRFFFFLCVLAISCLTAGAASQGNDNIGDNNHGSDNIGNNNQGNGNIGNNNTGNFNQGNDSLADLQEKAAHGDPAVQLELGGTYLFGDGVANDPEMAVKWLQQAAEYADKHPSWPLRSVAFAALGIACENNGGVKNIQEAIKWYFKSAMLNDPRGMTALSRIYSHGEGVPQDVVLGLAWMYVAAGSGAPGTADNDGIKIALSVLENKAGADGVALARKKCSELTAKIKK
jgi:TPR repeat protein